jgi:hypothetical protein
VESDHVRLTYAEMLSELQGLLGREVSVAISVRMARQRRPIAMLFGVLLDGQVGDLSWYEGAAIGYPSGEALFFNVNGSVFLIRAADFKLGRRYTTGDLSFEIGRVEFMVGLLRAPPNLPAG